MKRKPRRLYDAREGAVSTLQREVEKRRKKLIATIAYPLAGAGEPKAGGRGAKSPRAKRASAVPK
jgi:hypothetical protein